MSDQYPPQYPSGQESQGSGLPYSQNPYGVPPYGQQTFGAPGSGGPAPVGPNGEPPLWAPWYGISFGNAIRRFFKKYARFDGRASRSEYWWWALASWIVLIVLEVITSIGRTTSDVHVDAYTGAASGSYNALYWIGEILTIIWALGTIVPSLALVWRRLHDRNLAGPFVFLGFIPIAGPIIVLILTLLPSRPEGQRFDRPERG